MIRREPGFSLVELMIVIAIIGILAAIAYPGYRNYVIESRRTDAQVFLMTLRDKQERFYSDNHSYATTVKDLGMTPNPKKCTGKPPSECPDEADNRFLSPEGYWYANVASGGATFEVRAIPNTRSGSVNHKDDNCNTLAVDNQGRKGYMKKGAATVTWAAGACW